MKLIHCDFEFFLDDAWWTEAGVTAFVPSKPSYRATSDARQILTARIKDIQPIRRKLSAGVFNDDRETGFSAKERVISIFRAIRDDVPLPPVEVVQTLTGSAHRYKLTHGVHRLYCSLAAGFTHIPAVTGFDWGT